MSETIVKDWTKLGSTLREARHRQRMSQHELAERAGVSRSWLARVETGHRAAEFEQILLLVTALGLSMTLRETPLDSAPGSDDNDVLGAFAARHDDAAGERRRSWGLGNGDA